MNAGPTIIDLGHGPFLVEDLYHQVREKEGRLLSNEVVKRLPESGLVTPHRSEWKVRMRSVEILLDKLGAAGKPLNIFDVGCGNGWMSAMLAKAGHQVAAIDVHKSELEQAVSCFPQLPITWLYGDLIQLSGPRKRFDRVVFAASIQYFPDLPLALKKCFDEMLIPKGEVHVVDSPFYTSEEEQRKAKERSAQYYTKLGVPELAAFYHHHPYPSSLYGYTVRSERGRSSGALVSRKLPFEYIVIRR